jgi:hypothetical protein
LGKKSELLKPFRWNLPHHCFIAVRTNSEPLDFFANIYRYSDYLFQLSEQTLNVGEEPLCFSFQSFEHKDILSEHTAFCIVNKSMEKPQYLLGIDKNACYFLPQKRTKNQISFSFEHNVEETEKGREEDDWEFFKKNMQDTSVNLMGKIDYLFPVEIQTYEILKSLFLKFSDLNFLNHQFINSKHIKDIGSFLSQCYAGY